MGSRRGHNKNEGDGAEGREGEEDHPWGRENQELDRLAGVRLVFKS